MPSRWLVPLPGVTPQYTELGHLHAAISRWFDHTTAEHEANDKPYTISPLVGTDERDVGVEIATLTAKAERRLRQATAPGEQIRLGNQIRPIAPPRLLMSQSWADLAAAGSQDRWALEFVTPATFRRGTRTSPLPQPSTILHGLATAWKLWGDHDLPPLQPRTIADTVWVSDLDLRSETVPIIIDTKRPQGLRVSAVTGHLTIRCADRDAARTVGPLMQLASYTGVGSMTRRGLGVTRVRAGAPGRSRPAVSTPDGAHDGPAGQPRGRAAG